ncbi:MAG: CcmD family protein [Candidatus Methanoperedens sp.]|nr:CcmD family protein [Candidatus Methanoperedens sp.]
MSLSYLYEAFGIVWVVFIVYILNLLRQRRALESELKTLENMKA